MSVGNENKNTNEDLICPFVLWIVEHFDLQYWFECE